MNFTGLDASALTNFGVGLVPQQERVILPELVKFYLYPQLEDSHSYANYTVQRGFRFYRFSIYYAKHMFDNGFRVEDIECYSRLVRFMRKAKASRVVTVKENEMERNVTLLGGLSIVRGSNGGEWIGNKLAALPAVSDKPVFMDIFL
jgi:hypothetical protein